MTCASDHFLAATRHVAPVDAETTMAKWQHLTSNSSEMPRHSSPPELQYSQRIFGFKDYDVIEAVSKAVKLLLPMYCVLHSPPLRNRYHLGE
jgi:hypothetical protein